MYTVTIHKHCGKDTVKTFETLLEAYKEYNKIATQILFGTRRGGITVSIWDTKNATHIEWTDIYKA